MFRRLVPTLAIPLNVLAAVWVIAGSSLCPPVVPGAVTFLRFVLSPILTGGPGAATILMFVQRRHRGGVTAALAWLQIVLWTALTIFDSTGLALRDEQGARPFDLAASD
jgi:hypothetical protein